MSRKVRQTSAIKCDSCGSLSLENEDEDEALAVGDRPSMTRLRWCVDCCQNLCTDCAVIHGRLTASRSHCVLPLPAEESENRGFRGQLCPTHSDHTLDLFCWCCRQLVCTSCATSPEHRDHSCDEVFSSAHQLRTLLSTDAASVSDRLRRCDRLEEDITAGKDRWLSSVQTADREIKAIADKLRELVNRSSALLRDELTTTKQLKLKEVQHQLEDLAQERSRLQSLQRNLQAMTDGTTDVQLLLKAVDVHETTERCLAEPPAVASYNPASSQQTVTFVPSVAQLLSSIDGDRMLGRVEVAGGKPGEVSRPVAAGPSSKRISQRAGRVGHQRPTRQAATQCRHELLDTLSDSQLPVSGLAFVGDRLYVCRSQSPDVNVYCVTRTTYRRQRSIHVPGLTDPSDMAGTRDGETGTKLFISSESDGLVLRLVLTMERAGDVVDTRWSPDDRPYSVSLARSSTHLRLLVLSREAASVTVLDHNGHLLRRLRLPASVASPWSALPLPTSAADCGASDLVICHEDLDGGQRRCVSRLNWSSGAVTRQYKWDRRPPADRRGCTSAAMHMALESGVSEDGGGFLVTDRCCDVIQRVDNTLTSHVSLLTGDDDPVIEQPRRVCVEPARQHLVVGLHDGAVKIFSFSDSCPVM